MERSNGAPMVLGAIPIVPAPCYSGCCSRPLLALILGFFTFRNRIVGVYFTILTQALVMIVVTLFVGKRVDRGTNGLTGYNSILGFNLNAPSTKIGLYFITLAALAGAYILCRRIVNSRVGQVLEASRDGENRVRFLGFDPSRYKTFAFAVSGGLAGLAGMLFVLQVGIISPSMMGIVPSIEMVLWVALGGRGTLIGAIIGAVAERDQDRDQRGLSGRMAARIGCIICHRCCVDAKGLTGLWSKVVSSLSRRGGTVHATVREES